jgi:hypothetical protein
MAVRQVAHYARHAATWVVAEYALQDQCRRGELKAACLWFRAAHAYSEDEETLRVLCIEAYGKIERA